MQSSQLGRRGCRHDSGATPGTTQPSPGTKGRCSHLLCAAWPASSKDGPGRRRAPTSFLAPSAPLYLSRRQPVRRPEQGACPCPSVWSARAPRIGSCLSPDLVRSTSEGRRALRGRLALILVRITLCAIFRDRVRLLPPMGDSLGCRWRLVLNFCVNSTRSRRGGGSTLIRALAKPQRRGS